MKFSPETMSVGGTVVLPHSFVNSSDPGEITEITKWGIRVIWFKGEKKQQTGFFSYAWLNQTYGNKDDLDDDIPF